MTKTSKKGFTIVELLIVIVVIGILAAIVVVTYQGVQNKANTTAAQQNAREVANKATAFNASASRFPKTVTELRAANDGTKDYPEAKLSEKVDGLVNIGAPSASDKTRVQYQICTKGTAPDLDYVGAKAVYWDYEQSAVAEVKAGETSGTGVTCVAPAS